MLIIIMLDKKLMIGTHEWMLKYKPGPLFPRLPISGDLASKRDWPLFGTSIYRISASTSNKKFRKMTVLTSLLTVSLDFSALSTAQKRRKSRLTESYNVLALVSTSWPIDHAPL